MNYQLKLENIIENNKGKRVLLHSCCAPCSSYVISYLTNHFNITVLYYNPNIEPIEEYNKRKQEQIRLINEIPKVYNVDFLDCDYDIESYKECIKGLEREPERGIRCHKCYRFRLEKCASLAKELNYDFFGTTLSVSPYKDSKVLNEIGSILEESYGINYLYSDFKKKEGYKKSIELSKKYNLYRQNYCGCIYSIYTNKED